MLSDEEKLKRKRESQKKYKRSEKGKATQDKYYHSEAKHRANERYQKRNLLKKRAHMSVYNAKKTGKIIPLPCEFCGKESSQAHHHDYSKRLDVEWLCNQHHSYLHKNLIQIGGESTDGN